MWADPDGFADRLTRHHQVETSVVVDDGVELPVLSGSVTVDSRRDVRRTVDLDLLDVDGALLGILTPYGVKATVWQRLIFDDGRWEAPLGVFILSDPQYEQTQGGVTVSASGEDLSRVAIRAGRSAPVVVEKTDTLTTAVTKLINRALPQVEVTTNALDPTIGVRLTYPEGPDANPWGDAVGLAAGFGFDLAFNPLGEPVLTPFPDAVALQQPSVVLDPGPIIEASRAGGDDRTYSGVVAVGMASTGEPLRAEVWDTNPDSPTYIYGPFGTVPYWVQIDTPTTYDALLKTAKGLLATVTGASSAVTWRQIPNPGYDAWDVAQVDLPDLGVARAPMIVDSVTIPLGLGAQEVRAREGRWVE